MENKKRFCIIGASSRSTTMYAESIVKEQNEFAELVGIMDPNPGRAAYVAHTFGGDCPTFTDFDEMIRTAKPDALIVVCVDVYHAEYIIKGLELGLYVFTEKPMCINAEQVEAILETEKRTGNYIGVCFNMRYYDTVVKIKKLLNDGVIGDIYTANLEWMLARPDCNSGHGASYYHRWNGEMDKCGGLLITKATHHFDMANWFINQKPIKVSAFGKLRVYGAQNTPVVNGEKIGGESCHTCKYTDVCEFAQTSPDTEREEMFVKQEQFDGYHKDGCVWRKDVDIYDSMSISVEYDGGALLSYTESAAAAFEGWHMTLNGSKGRMEIAIYDCGGLTSEEKDGSKERPSFIRIIDLNNNVTLYDLPPARTGSHGGSDYELRKVLFAGATPEMPDQKATSIEGAYSVMIGAAANVSIAEHRIVTIRDLFKDPTLLDRK